MNKRWITKHTLIRELDLSKAEIRRLIVKCGLQAYDYDGSKISKPRPGTYRGAAHSWHLFDKEIAGCMFRPKDVLDCLKEHMPDVYNQILQHRQKQDVAKTPPESPIKQQATPDQGLTIPTPPGTTWGQIVIKVKNPYQIEIRCPGMDGHTNRERQAIGLTDKPWDYFLKMARDQGEYVPPAQGKERELAAKNFQLIRKAISNLFPDIIKGKPIEDFNRKTGAYKAAFTIAIDENLIKNIDVQNAIGDDDHRRKEIEQLFKEQQIDVNN